MARQWRIRHLSSRLNVLPPAVLTIIAILILTNAIIWAAVGIVLHYNPAQVGTAVLSYTLGLRHALDADHIAAIDLMTRRLVADGQRPVTVGTWFSLGHSTIVIITCIVVAATAGALQERFGGFEYIGGIVGTSVSAAVLALLCVGNAWVLCGLWRRLRQVLDEPVGTRGDDGAADGDDEGHVVADLQLDGPGFLVRILKRFFALVDRPWKMYPLGILFGLGFDTSSEIAVIGISSLTAARGTSLWVILIFPLLFTAGMCLVDTIDGALMMTLYTSKTFARDKVAILYYSIVLTAITVVVSAFIGIIQILSLAQNVAQPKGRFWDGLTAISDHFEIVGASIVGIFVSAGLGSALVYGPWRRRLEKRRASRGVSEEATPDEEIWSECHDSRVLDA
ncbi:NicO-domain-containing protein [Xylaria sp. CBS 124048]|nr:NicO-domain-containing protein [Xylaria sp. CBS 124048]